MDRPAVTDLIQQNVDTIARIELAAQEGKSRADRLADAVSGFCGRIEFVWAQCTVFIIWIALNTSAIIPKAWRLDPFPYPILILTLAMETIFLSTFILISQNRERLIADKRNHLELQINLLAEQEASQMLTMLQEMMRHMGMNADNAEVDALRQAANPEEMLGQIEESLNPSTEEQD